MLTALSRLPCVSRREQKYWLWISTWPEAKNCCAVEDQQKFTRPTDFCGDNFSILPKPYITSCYYSVPSCLDLILKCSDFRWTLFIILIFGTECSVSKTRFFHSEVFLVHWIYLIRYLPVLSPANETDPVSITFYSARNTKAKDKGQKSSIVLSVV
jgi:hypothetical protein